MSNTIRAGSKDDTSLSQFWFGVQCGIVAARDGITDQEIDEWLEQVKVVAKKRMATWPTYAVAKQMRAIALAAEAE